MNSFTTSSPSCGNGTRNCALRDLLFNTQGHVRNNRRYPKQIDLHLCESAEVRDWLVAHGQDEASIRVVESGVDTTEYKPVERKRGSRLQVGFSGRLSEEKAPLAFVDLARVLSGPDFHFAMTGAGPLETAVRRRAAGLSDDSFRISESWTISVRISLRSTCSSCRRSWMGAPS